MEKTTKFKLLSMLIGVFVALVIGEVACRIHYFGVDAFSYKKINSFVPMGVSGFLKKAESDSVLYELEPNINDYFKLKKFETNAHGCRDKHYEVDKTDNTIRGIVIGDSFTMGSGVDIENVYHSVVERKLNERNDGKKYELINFGVGGYNLLNYLGVLEEKTKPLNPDFVIISFTGDNDFFLPSKRHYDGDYKVKIKTKKKELFFTSFLKVLALNIFSKKPSSEKILFDIGDQEKAYVNESFNAFKQYSIAQNIPVIINYISLREDNGNLDIVKSIAKKNGLYFTDSDGKFSSKPNAEYHIHKLDQHPNAEAHEIFANTLLEFKPLINIINEK